MKKILITTLLTFSIFTAQAKSITDYEREAERGNSNSAFSAGLVYEMGIQGKINKNQNKAIRYYEMAHKGGNIKATARLGVINYNKGDYKKALEYFKVGANKEEGLSEAYLGKILENNKKGDTAIKFYEKSVKNNNPYGKMFLGEYYIKNSKKGSDNFLRGYALLVSANKQNKEAKSILNRYPYKFNKDEQDKLRKFIAQY
jgi:TPR repeat protein